MTFEIHTTRVESLLKWVQQHALDQYPFLSSCCGLEFAAAAAPANRQAMALPKASPRQADLLVVVGTVTERQAPTLRRIYEQMGDPKWVIAFGACAATGGMYQNYAVVPGADQVVPVDVYVPGCPPRPEQFAWAVSALRSQIAGQPPRTAAALVAIRPYNTSFKPKP